jgi:hypothetical protein
MFEAHAQRVIPGGQSFGQMIEGAAILAVAVFAPFVVWRLIPVVEAAAVAHGLSRMPSRAAMTAAHTATTLRFLGVGGKGGRSSGGGGEEHPALADLPSRSLEAGGAEGGAPSASGAGAGGTGAAAGAGGSAGAGAGAGAGAAGAAVAPVVVAAEGAKKAKDRATASADAQTQSSTGGGDTGGGWSFRPEDS